MQRSRSIFIFLVLTGFMDQVLAAMAQGKDIAVAARSVTREKKPTRISMETQTVSEADRKPAVVPMGVSILDVLLYKNPKDFTAEDMEILFNSENLRVLKAFAMHNTVDREKILQRIETLQNFLWSEKTAERSDLAPADQEHLNNLFNKVFLSFTDLGAEIRGNLPSPETQLNDQHLDTIVNQQREITDLKSQVAEKSAAHAEAIAAMSTQHEQAMAATQNAHNVDVAALRGQLAEQNAAHQAELKMVRDQHAAATASTQAAHDAEVAALRRQIEMLNTQHAAETASTQAAHDSHVAELQRQLAEQKASHAQERLQLKGELAKTQQDLREAKAQTLRERLLASVQALGEVVTEGAQKARVAASRMRRGYGSSVSPRQTMNLESDDEEDDQVAPDLTPQSSPSSGSVDLVELSPVKESRPAQQFVPGLNLSRLQPASKDTSEEGTPQADAVPLRARELPTPRSTGTFVRGMKTPRFGYGVGAGLSRLPVQPTSAKMMHQEQEVAAAAAARAEADSGAEHSDSFDMAD